MECAFKRPKISTCILYRLSVFELQYFAIGKETSTVVNAQSAAVVDVSSFAEILEQKNIRGTMGSYTIMTNKTSTLRSYDSAVSIVIKGLVSALDNEKIAESTKNAFQSTVAANIGKFQFSFNFKLIM